MEACPDDERLAAMGEGELSPEEASAMLAHLDRCGVCQAVIGTSVSVESPELVAGQRVGRYLVENQVGAGSMGVVYRAYDPELGRAVALKFLHRRHSQRRMARARLLREAQALAQLAHPNVLQIYDVGEDLGSVFIATEFVEGPTLREWCRLKTPKEILDMHLRAGEGLAAAHRRDLVHRDFKPANVLICADGRPRVADFGLVCAARSEDTGDDLLGDQGETGVDMTRDGGMVGTPAYMSPEQLAGSPASAASDQFSFCVTLYEALYGVRPFSGQTTDELRRAICAGCSAPSGGEVPHRWFRVLARGLHPDPCRRYPDMEALLAALAKNTKRRLLGIGIGIGVLCLAVSGGALHEEQSPCTASADLASLTDAFSAARAVLDERPEFAEKAAKVTDEYPAHWQEAWAVACHHSEEREPTASAARQCLEARRIEAIQTARIIGEQDHPTFADLGRLYQLSPPSTCLAPSDEFRGRIGLPGMGVRIRTVYAVLARVEALHNAGDLTAALALLERSGTLRDSVMSPGLSVRGTLLQGRLLVELGEPDRGIELLERAYAEATEHRLDPLAHQAAVRLMRAHGVGREDADRGAEWDASARALQDAVGPNERIHYLQGKAALLVHHQRSDEALALIKRATRWFDADVSELTKASVYARVAQTSLMNGDFATAETHYARVLDTYLELYGESHPNVGAARLGLADAALRLGDLEQAEQLLELAHEQLLADVGPGHHLIGLVLDLKAEAASTRGDFDLALEHHREAIELAERADSQSRHRLRSALRSMSLTYEQAGDHAEALRLRERVLVLAESDEGPESFEAALSHNNLGAAKLALGNPEHAEKHFRRSIVLIEQTRGPDTFFGSYPRIGLGEALLEQEHALEARDWLEDALRVAIEAGDDTQTAAAAAALARILGGSDEPSAVARALTLAGQAEQIWATHTGFARELDDLSRWRETL